MKPCLFITAMMLFHSAFAQNFHSNKWEEGMYVKVSRYGGKQPRVFEVFISKDSCFIIRTQVISKAIFSLTSDELNNLFQMIQKVSLPSIKTAKRKNIAYDKSTTAIELKIGKTSYRVAEGAGEVIKPQSKVKEVYNLINYIENLAYTKASAVK